MFQANISQTFNSLNFFQIERTMRLRLIINLEIMEKSELLHSYEKDFEDCLNLLKKIVEDPDPASILQKN